MPFDQALDNGIDGKLVAPGMHAELKAPREPEFLDREGNDAQVLVEFFFKLREVAHVIDPFVEPPGELRSDGWNRYPLLADHRQDQEQFHGILRQIGLVDRDFGYKSLRTLPFLEMTVNPTCLLHGEQKLAGGTTNGFL